MVSVCTTAQPASLKGRGFESRCIQFVANVKHGNRTLGLTSEFSVENPIDKYNQWLTELRRLVVTGLRQRTGLRHNNTATYS